MRQNLALMRSESGHSRDPLVVANFLEGHPQSKSPPIAPPPHPPTAALSSSQLLHNSQPTPPARDVQSTNQRLAQVRAQVAAEEAAAMALEEELTKRSSSTAIRKPPSCRSDPQTATSAAAHQTDTEKGSLMPSRGLHDMANPSTVVEAHTHAASTSALPDRASSQPRSALAAGTESQHTRSRDGTSLQLDASDLIRSLELESLVARTIARDENDNATQFDRTREATRALIQQILHDMGANLARADAEGESACSTHQQPHTQVSSVSRNVPSSAASASGVRAEAGPAPQAEPHFSQPHSARARARAVVGAPVRVSPVAHPQAEPPAKTPPTATPSITCSSSCTSASGPGGSRRSQVEMTPELWGVMGLIRSGDIRGLIQATREMRTRDLRQLSRALQ